MKQSEPLLGKVMMDDHKHGDNTLYNVNKYFKYIIGYVGFLHFMMKIMTELF